MEEQVPHKRRVRYKGTHPKHFSEKYKELQPEKYADTLEHIKNKGMTPAGTHRSVMVNEVLENLCIRPGMRGLDCTLGYGGHCTEMLLALQGNGHIDAIDIDPIESAKTEKRLREKGFGPELLTIHHMNYGNALSVAESEGRFDFVLADLGVSSMQLDNPERGFTWKADGPLDLRMNPEVGESAAECLKRLSRDDLIGLLIENSDEPYAEKIANAIKRDLKKGKPIETTWQLRDCIQSALPVGKGENPADLLKKTCQRVFQALRIEVNSEFVMLEKFLWSVPKLLNPGGRIVVLTFHSGEDRMVKQIFRELERTGELTEVCKDVIRPTGEECTKNPRAHSTKLRYAVK